MSLDLIKHKDLHFLPMPDEKNWKEFVDYEFDQLGRTISVENSCVESREKLIDVINMLLMNFWRSCYATSHKFSFSSLSGPQIGMGVDLDNPEATKVSWKCRIFIKKKRKNKSNG